MLDTHVWLVATMHASVLSCFSHVQLLSSSVHGIFQARILVWVAMPLLQSIFPSQEWNPCLLCLLNWQAGSLPLAPPGKPSGHRIGSTKQDFCYLRRIYWTKQVHSFQTLIGLLLFYLIPQSDKLLTAVPPITDHNPLCGTPRWEKLGALLLLLLTWDDSVGVKRARNGACLPCSWGWMKRRGGDVGLGLRTSAQNWAHPSPPLGRSAIRPHAAGPPYPWGSLCIGAQCPFQSRAQRNLWCSGPVLDSGWLWALHLLFPGHKEKRNT